MGNIQKETFMHQDNPYKNMTRNSISLLVSFAFIFFSWLQRTLKPNGRVSQFLQTEPRFPSNCMVLENRRSYLSMAGAVMPATGVNKSHIFRKIIVCLCLISLAMAIRAWGVLSTP